MTYKQKHLVMKIGERAKLIINQALEASENYPELFEYLLTHEVEVSNAYDKLSELLIPGPDDEPDPNNPIIGPLINLFRVANLQYTVPNPDKIPKVKKPIVFDLINEAIQPSENPSECHEKFGYNPFNGSNNFLTERFRALMLNICLNGLYIRTGSLQNILKTGRSLYV